MKKTLMLALLFVFTLVFVDLYESVFGQESSNPGSYIPGEHNGDSDYYEHLQAHPWVTPEINPIIIYGMDFDDEQTTAEVKLTDEYDGVKNALYVPEEGQVTWTAEVPEAGYYHIGICYYPVKGKSSAIERRVLINGELQFSGAKHIIIPRLWHSETKAIRQDLSGNDIKPRQVEAPRWRKMLFRDDLGYIEDPYLFYFEEGNNTITLEAVKEPIVIDYLFIESYRVLPTYEEVKAYYQEQGYKEVKGKTIKIQAEYALETSSPTLYPQADKTSSLTEPFSYRHVRLNSIGGMSWRVNGDFITWEVDVPESGLYHISFRAKQNFFRGTFVNRELWINDQIPFEEAKYIEFNYDSKWQLVTLGNEKEDYLFYLEKGKNTITLVATLGKFGALIDVVEVSLSNINALYREIIRYTGPNPDIYRDYQLTQRIPDLVDRLQEEIDRLNRVIDGVVSITGEQSDYTAIISKLIIQMKDFVKRPRDMHKRLTEFKENISGLGTWIIDVSQQPLLIDYILVHSDESKLPKANEGLIGRLWHQLRLFIASFFTDYTSINATKETEIHEIIEVWVPVPTKSRDHANILRQLIDEDFTPNTGIGVDLKLVKSEVLLPATLTGQGPDVAMSIDETLPVNYALRGAVYDLTNFDDFEEVAERFHPSALTPFSFEGGVYALPEEQYFLMMFYRSDILNELGLKVPETWDDVISMIPVLQKHYLDFYMPVGPAQFTTARVHQVFASILYQHGGEFFNETNTSTALTTREALDAFERWTNYYTSYGFAVEANFENRFRSGEAPIGIASYSVYNVLSVFAPEIRGNWGFAPIPGTIQRDRNGKPILDENGNPVIRRDAVGTSLGMVLLEQSQKKEAAWEFMKWFTSKDVQARYGQELEGVLGTGARYPTANIEALEELPWTVEDLAKLKEQWQYVRGIPQVPGSYMLARNIINAFYDSYNNGTNPREAMINYARYVDEEIIRKRKEFGLSH